MKITHMFAAALLMAGIGVSTEASAQRYDGGPNQDLRYDRQDHNDHNDRRWDRRYDRHDDHRDHRDWSNRGNDRSYGWRGDRGRSDCRAVYRHGHRYTVCR